ncbi:hypothetical protein HK102_000880 [Quaeritorhiza haematococci]|nr:hypothetical protein HK102_000880 [Quaeritorhiza haematococci]
MKFLTAITAALSVVAVQSVNAQFLPVPPGPGGDQMSQLRLFKRDPVFNGLVAACNPIAAAWLRAAFHDAGTFDGTSGGADGSLQFELNDADNRGLEQTITIFQGFKKKYPQVSMADIINWGAIISVKVCGGPDIPFRAGRKDATTRNPPGLLPGPNVPIPELLSRFQTLGLNAREFVALTAGAHSVGGRNKRLRGFDGTAGRFDNAIFKVILQNQAIFQSDNGLAGNSDTRPIVEEFANNQQAFHQAFASSYVKMMEIGINGTSLVVVD